MTLPASGPRARLPRAVEAWLELEQGVNERLVNEAQHVPIAADLAKIPAPYRPEDRAVWEQTARFSPLSEVRIYGDPLGELARAGVALEKGRAPLFQHPWPVPGARARREARATGINATPTSSYRSLLSWRRGRAPFVLKLSMNVTIGEVRRHLREEQVARGVVVSRVLATIPRAHRDKVGLEWFDERGGVADRRSRTGWLLRALPPSLRRAHGSPAPTLVPAFSLVSRCDDDVPLLVSMIRASELSPGKFVMRHVLRPYISALSYLVLMQGIEPEPHMQNVLFEVAEGMPTGKLVLRDWSDTSVNWPLRIARRLRLDAPSRRLSPRSAPFRLVGIVAGHHLNFGRRRLARAGDTVERYGLRSFVWALGEALVRYFPDFPRAEMEHAYLKLWQDAAVAYLGCRPEVVDGPRRIAIDEALRHFLEHTGWEEVPGYGNRAALPEDGEALRIGPLARRKSGRAYARVETAIGDLFLDGPRPVFLRPAF